MTYAHDEGASQYERNAAALIFGPQTSASTDLYRDWACSCEYGKVLASWKLFQKVSRCPGDVCTRPRVATMVDRAALELPIVPNECTHPSLRSSGSVRGRPTAITRS